MTVFSKKIALFISEIHSMIGKILSEELGLKVRGGRFFDFSGKFSYPISVTIYDNKSMLGYFDSEFYELGFHRQLMHVSREKLENIIKHEIAHFMTFIKYGKVASHGPEFKSFCVKSGWGEEIYGATTCLDQGSQDTAYEHSSIFRKVQKLLALAQSSNKHEAELAMIKSRQILLKHNIESKYFAEEETIVLKRILRQKKENAKMRSIAKILETFFVNTVYRKTKEAIYLEISGTAVNVEIAEYVKDVLDRELERLWSQTKLEYPELKGSVAKNSFFLGVAKGYCDKVGALKKMDGEYETRGIILIEAGLSEARRLLYPRLSGQRSRGSHCEESAKLGKLRGKDLTIKPSLKAPERSILSFITQKF